MNSIKILIVLGRSNKNIREQRVNSALNYSDIPDYYLFSGGNGEAERMKDYALSKNVPKEKILTETKSKNTVQNLIFSNELLVGQFPSRTFQITICSSTSHTIRAFLIAHKWLTCVNPKDIILIDSEVVVPIYEYRQERMLIQRL